MRRTVLVLACALALSCGSDSTSPTAPDPSSKANENPTAVISVSPTGPALVGATILTFTATAADPEGGALGYSWTFGDGSSASGQTVTHVFGSDGIFDVTLTVTDDRGGSTTAVVAVDARSLSGEWTPFQNGVPGIDATIVHAGSAISGESTNQCCTHTFSGEVSHPRDIRLVFRFFGCPTEDRTFVGTVAADLNRIDLAGPNCNVPNTTYGFTRK
jgi:hypothetical protein